MSDYIDCVNTNDGFHSFIIIIFVILTLLLMGILKGLCGYYWVPAIGAWGLGVIFYKPCRLEHYYECELKDRDVLHDSNGCPIHPDTGECSVRLLHPITELWVNCLFFIIYPMALLLRGFQSCQRCYETFDKMKRKKNDDEVQLVDANNSSICTDERDDDDDTKYVMNKLQESRSSIDKVKSELNLMMHFNQAVQYKSSILNELKPEASCKLKKIQSTTSILKCFTSKHSSDCNVYLTVKGSFAISNGAKDLNPQQSYQIKGKFEKTIDGHWKFIPIIPFLQYWSISPIYPNRMTQLVIPHELDVHKFIIEYNSLEEAIEYAKELDNCDCDTE